MPLLTEIIGFLTAFSTSLLLWSGSLGGLFPAEEATTTNFENYQSTTSASVISVIDGDTIDVLIEGGSEPVRVRYIGIDTPEPYTTSVPECGSESASKRNTQLVASTTILLVSGLQTYDTYNRLLAYVYVGNLFINEVLVAEGWADIMMIPPNTKYQDSFTELRNTARRHGWGMWQGCTDVH